MQDDLLDHAYKMTKLLDKDVDLNGCKKDTLVPHVRDIVNGLYQHALNKPKGTTC